MLVFFFSTFLCTSTLAHTYSNIYTHNQPTIHTQQTNQPINEPTYNSPILEQTSDAVLLAAQGGQLNMVALTLTLP